MSSETTTRDLALERERVLRLIRAHQAELRALGISRLWLFGSLARGDAGRGSDVDVLISMAPTRRFSLLEPAIAERWFSWPNLAWLSPVPLVTLAVAVALDRAVAQRRERLPFLLTMALFLLSFLGLGISLWPHAVPPGVTIWDAAAPPESQRFLLIGVAIMLPVVLAYTAFSYYVFRGKVRPGEGYH